MTALTSPATVTVARLAPADTGFSAALHRSALPHGFFTRLGMRFLAAYHETFVDSPHGVALAAWHDGERVGMLVGTTDNRAHYHWVLRQRGTVLAAIAVLALARRPRVAAEFVRTRVGRYARGVVRLVRRRITAECAARRGAGAEAGAASGRPVARIAVLTHVAVTEGARGLGAGRALVADFEEHARAAGASACHLVTKADSTRNHRFYSRCGWEHRGDDLDHDGMAISRFVRLLDGEAAE